MVRASLDAKFVIVLITASQRSVMEAFKLKAGSRLVNILAYLSLPLLL